MFIYMILSAFFGIFIKIKNINFVSPSIHYKI